MLESRHSSLEEEVRRLSRELGERGEEALRESGEHEALITRSIEERKRLQVICSKIRGDSSIGSRCYLIQVFCCVLNKLP